MTPQGKEMKTKIFEDSSYKSKVVYSGLFFDDNTPLTESDVLNENAVVNGRITNYNSAGRVQAVMLEGILVNASKTKAKFIEPKGFDIVYEKTGTYKGELMTVVVSRVAEIPHSQMEWAIEATKSQTRRFTKYKTSFLNERIPSEAFFIPIHKKDMERKDEIIKTRAKDVLAKLPLPIKREWLSQIIDSLEVSEMNKTHETDISVFKVSLPTEGTLEKIIVSAYKGELWLEHHKQAPRLPSVKDGVFLIENFELKKWQQFIKEFGMEKFKGYSEYNQQGIVSLVELVGPEDALKALKKYGSTIWHGIETKSFFKARRELNLIPNRDIPKIDSILAEIKLQLKDDPENNALLQEQKEFEGKKEIMLARFEKLNATSAKELEDGVKDVLRVAYSSDDAQHKNSSLLKAGIENIGRLIPHMKKKDIKFTRKNLKLSLIELEYENVRYPEIARVCSRAKVSQAEFEIYQNLWFENTVAREKAPVRIPTLSGSVGNLEWEMCDARDENILTAGNETNCCQHPLSVGGACVTYMLQNPETSTIFRCTKKGSDKTIVQSFVWVDTDRNILCFDNIEALAGISEKITDCYQDYVDQVEKLESFRFQQYAVGMQYTAVETNNLTVASEDKKARVPSTLSYTDARGTQRIFRTSSEPLKMDRGW